MSDQLIDGGRGCWECGARYSEHVVGCSQLDAKNTPLRFRVRLNGKHPNGSASRYQYGVYFPLTDLVVGDMGSRGTGKPTDVEWIDKPME